MFNRALLHSLETVVLFFAVASPLIALEPFATLEAPPVPFPYDPGGFGASVVISGDSVAVGAPTDQYPNASFGRGAVFVFRWTGDAWAQEAKLIGSQAGFRDFFGSSVALQGDVLVVGEAHGDPVGSAFGQAYVFRRVGDTWIEEAILSPSISVLGDHFGRAVGIDNERIVVTAPGTGVPVEPAVTPRLFVFQWNGAAWVEVAALTPSDAETGEDIATVVAIHGDDILVGAPLDDAPLEDSGSVYPFHWTGTAWLEEPKLTPNTPLVHARFGRSVAISADGALVGGGGVVRHFRRVSGAWTETSTITAADTVPGDEFGRNVSVTANLLAVSTPSSAYVFDLDGSAWVERTKINPPPPGSFGDALAVDGRWVVVSGVFVYCVGLDAPCIPTLGWSGVLALGVMLLIGAATVLRRRRACMIFLLSPLLVSVASADDPRLAYPHDPERLLVRFKENVTEAARDTSHAGVGGQLLQSYSVVGGLQLVHVEAGNLAATLAAYSVDPNVLYAEPDFEYDALAIPNDTYFSSYQWALQNTGQSILGVVGIPGADIRAVSAWDYWQGDANFRVAVIDTGMKLDHPDLTANLWRNPAECPGATCVVNGIDEDGNGYIDDFHGWNLDPSSCASCCPGGCPNPQPWNPAECPNFLGGHGTRVSGTIGAASNNARGVAGVIWQCKIVVVRVDADGADYPISRLVAALQYAIDNDIKVSNNSYGGGAFSQSHYDAILAARDQIGHIFVASAGNSGQDNDVVPLFPASYDLPNIISVAATDNRDELASFSHYGATSVDIAAPGVSIITPSNTRNSNGTCPAEGYVGLLSGTSLAAPHVTGVVALVWSRWPGWDWTVVKNRVLRTARQVPALSGKCVSGGVVNAYTAINDCNLNGTPDTQEIAQQTAPDCNANDVPDWCDLADGFSTDCDEDSVLDDCEPLIDCNNNSVQDACDIAHGTSEDCEPNGVPDECTGSGACCLTPSGPCEILTLACCEAQDGWYFGDGSKCRVWTCGQIMGPSGP